MSIKIKTETEIEKMRAAGKLAAQVLEMIEPHVKEGVTTEELNRICHEFTLRTGHTQHLLITTVSQNRFVPLLITSFATVSQQKRMPKVVMVKTNQQF